MQIQRNPERKSCCLSTSLNFAADFLQEAMHDDVRVSALRQFFFGGGGEDSTVNTDRTPVKSTVEPGDLIRDTWCRLTVFGGKGSCA